MSWLKRQYALAWADLRGPLKRPFLLCTLAFLLLCAGSYALLGRYAAQAAEIYASFAQMVEDSGLADAAGNIQALGLFSNNLRAAGMGLLAGMVPFIFLPALVLLVNAAVIGAVLAFTGGMGADVGSLILRGILPHGVFELPAVLLSCAMGLCLCRTVTAQVRRRPGAPRIEEELRRLVRVFLTFCTPMLVLAAIIEADLTPVLLSL